MQHHNVVVEGTLSVKNCILTDCIEENTTGSGVTIEDVLIKDGKLPTSSIPDPLLVNTINERDAGYGVTVEGVAIKDTYVTADNSDTAEATSKTNTFLRGDAVSTAGWVALAAGASVGSDKVAMGFLSSNGGATLAGRFNNLGAWAAIHIGANAAGADTHIHGNTVQCDATSGFQTDIIAERTGAAGVTFSNDIVVNGTASADTPTANGHLATKLYVDSSKTLATVLTAGNATGGTDINMTSGSEIVSSEGPGIILDATAGPIVGSASSVISFIAANTATYNGTVCNFQATSGNMNLVASDSILLAPGTGNAQIDGNVLVNQNTVIDMGNDDFSPTLAQIRTGYLTQNNFTTTADHDLTLPTGTVLNGITNGVAAVGASFSMIVCNENNSSGFTRTVLGNTNVSFQGAGSIVYSGETGFFLITKVLASPLKWVIIRQDQGVSSTTGVVGAAFTANSGTAINTASTFGGYTVAQISSALSRVGSLF